MIVVDKPLNVRTSEDIAPSPFYIAGTRKAFEILSGKNLYSDVVTAVIREVSCNAADSHVAAGKGNIPFTVHLPNTLEPFFSVRDDGLGMSDEQIRGRLAFDETSGKMVYVNGLYTTFFASNKTTSNDFTGCLGLGSKSPFGYTDQFTVESRYNGVKATYSCFKNEEGLPVVAKLGEEPTDEPNGVQISFPVKSSDFYEFTNKAQEVFLWFTPRPEVKGYKINYEERDYLRTTDKYGLSSLSRCNYSDSHIVMGNVAYQINSHDLRNEMTLDDIERKVLEWGCDLFVPIGSVEVTANREKVSYDAKSLQTIRECLKAAVGDIKAEVETQISQAPTIWQARTALYEARNSILGLVRNLAHVSWKGQEIQEYINVRKFPCPCAECTKARTETPAAAPCRLLCQLAVSTLRPLKLEIASRHRKNFRKRVADTIHADRALIFLDDMDRGGYTRIVTKLNANNKETAYILSGASREWLDATGIGEVVIRASSLPKPEPRNNNYVPRRQGSKAKLNELILSGSNAPADHWKPAEVDVDKGGVFVEILYFRYKKPGHTTTTPEGNTKDETFHPSGLREVSELLAKLGHDKPIYGIRPGDTKLLQKHEGWLALDEYVECVLAENKQYGEKAKKLAQWNGLGDRKAVNFFDEKFDKDSLFGQFVQKCKEAKEASEDEQARAYLTLANRYSVKVEGLESDVKESEDEEENYGYLGRMRDKVNEVYPLLSHLSWYHDEKGFRKAVVDYITAIDAKKEIK